MRTETPGNSDIKSDTGQVGIRCIPIGPPLHVALVPPNRRRARCLVPVAEINFEPDPMATHPLRQAARGHSPREVLRLASSARRGLEFETSATASEEYQLVG